MTITVTNKSGKSAKAEVKLSVTPVYAPTITVLQEQVNVFGGALLSINGNELRIGDELVASWTDKNNEKCECAVTVGGAVVNS